ncbi:alkyl hydroperoxide reductase subunit F [Enterococcus durans]|uniref:alkyl hydroperoxide reductase subunit F n=1 Tax=Enterococcus durans TaxID=53345 RepID=UPI001020FECC|nr:alkyl hydroperoxide reductase subunit F [Enterococcus durans]MZG88770.1 alkyl hydroperoxide reductase subunit F [Enterococcus durans]MZG91690.1 alkyl hydroperoxide reductase subunit F [Enterococcus durans]MZH18726.1 alkyl hydroperoxide reductase subunit F [Enterococcus durans]MZH21639.1 alkyl hydroperoxide reductase subunit F [Enterococcus durans]MZH24160.1 alkyl hydroperoxide reductase subunit F [Enterococcus durans]
MLDKETKQNLAHYLEMLESPVIFSTSTDDSNDSRKLLEFLNEIAQMTEKVTIEEKKLSRTPSFEINPLNGTSGIAFAGIPLGHEFSSFLLALLQVSGRPPKITDSLTQQIKQIQQDLYFETYVSLTCHNCPDVVQALNILSVLNPTIHHTMIEGGMYQNEITEKQVLAVPTVYLNGQEFASGRMTLEQIIEQITGPQTVTPSSESTPYDVLVIGGGPAASSAAIYAALKGIRTGLVADSLGGQVIETLGIENMIGTPYTEGPQLMKQVEEHLRSYPVDIMTNQLVTSLQKQNDSFAVSLKSGRKLTTKTAIIATGARWRSINVPGEKEFKNKGIAYCPHCDGPLFTGKDVAVIGGGNSGIEAAIDLAGLANHVYVLEFLSELKADKILQDKLATLSNVTILLNAETQEITGTTYVDSITYKDRTTGENQTLDVAGVFILIGLVPNTEWLSALLEMNERGEIIVDLHGETSIKGLFAAGDCTNSSYKQIIISMGSGATAALGAFDYLMRN